MDLGPPAFGGRYVSQLAIRSALRPNGLGLA